MSLSLGIDASTQSCSGLVIDPAAGRIVARSAINFGERLPGYNAPQGFLPEKPDGGVHADPMMWLDALELLFAELSQQCDLSKITAISGAAQQHGSVYLGPGWPAVLGTPDPERPLAEQIRPCLTRATAPIWMDTSTAEECREIASASGGPEIVCQKSGSVPAERFTGPQIRRFAKQQPAAYGATTRIHLVSSFLCSVLIGGDAPIDTGDGAGTNLLNLQSGDWDPDLLQATAPDLGPKLPPIVPGTTRAGALAPYFTQKYGFAAGAAVTVFTGDNPSSLVGMGASAPGKVVVSLGTSDTFFAAMPEGVPDPSGHGHVFGNPFGGSMSLQCFINGSLAREAVKDTFAYSWEDFAEALASTPPGNGGRLMIPFFRPEISPRIDLRQPLLHDGDAFRNWREPRATVRACVEGQFLNMKLQTRWMGLQPETIYLTGGASRNDAIARILADIFQTRVQRLATSDAVALGGALRAAANLGFPVADLEERFCRPEAEPPIEPTPEAGRVYGQSIRLFEELLRDAATYQ